MMLTLTSDVQRMVVFLERDFLTTQTNNCNESLQFCPLELDITV